MDSPTVSLKNGRGSNSIGGYLFHNTWGRQRVTYKVELRDAQPKLHHAAKQEIKQFCTTADVKVQNIINVQQTE